MQKLSNITHNILINCALVDNKDERMERLIQIKNAGIINEEELNVLFCR